MSQVSEAYEKLKMAFPSEIINIDGMTGVMTYEGSTASAQFAQSDRGVEMALYWNGKRYDYRLNNSKEVVDIVKGLKKGRIKLEEVGTKEIYAKKFNWYRENQRSMPVKILMLIFGTLIVSGGSLLAFAGIVSTIKKHGTMEMDDIGLFIICFAFIYAGVSLIWAALGHAVYESLYFMGVNSIGFGAGMIFFMLKDYFAGEDDTGDVLAGCLLFLITLMFGVLFLSLSFLKQKKSDVRLRRTPNLPNPEQMKLIFEQLSKDRGRQAFFLRPSNTMPSFAGSRVGGLPYSDGSLYIPTSVNGRPMAFLFQINLSDVGTPSPLPQTGLLQFYLDNATTAQFSTIRVIYYRFVNDMITSQFGRSYGIKLEQGFTPDIWNYRLEDVYTAAYKLGIPLDTDLEYNEVFSNRVFKVQADDYLLGSARLMPPRTERNLGEWAVNQPLISISPKSPLYAILRENAVNMPFNGFQIFISEAALHNSDFTQTYTQIETF